MFYLHSVFRTVQYNYLRSLKEDSNLCIDINHTHYKLCSTNVCASKSCIKHQYALKYTTETDYQSKLLQFSKVYRQCGFGATIIYRRLVFKIIVLLVTNWGAFLQHLHFYLKMSYILPSGTKGCHSPIFDENFKHNVISTAV